MVQYIATFPLMLQKAMNKTMFDSSNIIIMRKQLENTFDKWDWTIIPEGPDHYKVRYLASLVLFCD